MTDSPALPFDVTDRLRARFFAKVRKTDGCWLWTGGSRGVGYGAFKAGHRAYDAHRVSYMLHVGPIPSGMLVTHTCDVRACVNPDHLKLGTYATNRQEMTERGPATSIRETRSEPLTEEEIAEIIHHYTHGVSMGVICRKFRVARSSLDRLLVIRGVHKRTPRTEPRRRKSAATR